MGGDASSRVGTASLDEEFQSFRVDLKMPPVKLLGKLCGARAVLRVMAVVMAAGVVQQRKKHDHIPPETGRDLAETQTLFQNPRPMRRTVQPVPFETILPPDLDEQAFLKRRFAVWHGEAEKSVAELSPSDCAL